MVADQTNERKYSKRKESFKYILFLMRRNPLSIVGWVILIFLVACALLAPVIAPYDPLATDASVQFVPPGPEHLFGTDAAGMDVFSRVLYGARYDLLIAISAVLLSIAVGVPVGSVVGYFGGRLDEVVMRILDTMQAFPMFILAMGIIAALGQSMGILVAVIAFVNFPTYVRLIRASMMSLKEGYFCEAARSLGYPPVRIIFRHMLPNCLSPVIIQASLNSGWAILTAASLGFLGLGVKIPQPEWGAMITQGADYIITGEWWIAFFPGLCIMLSVLAFNLIGDTLDDLLDPRRR